MPRPPEVPNDPDFERDAMPAGPGDLLDILDDASNIFIDALSQVETEEYQRVIYTLDETQLSGHPLGARFDHVSVEYRIDESLERPGYIETSTLFTFSRSAKRASKEDDSSTAGFTEFINITESLVDPLTSSREAKGFVIMSGGMPDAQAAIDSLAGSVLSEEETAQIANEVKELQEVSPVPDSHPGVITRENVSNMHEALQIVLDTYPELRS